MILVIFKSYLFIYQNYIFEAFNFMYEVNDQQELFATINL